MDQSLLDDIKAVSAKLHELNAKGVLSISPYNNVVQITYEAFTDMFNDFMVEPRESEQYPYQTEAVIDGFKFIALLTSEQAEVELREAV